MNCLQKFPRTNNVWSKSFEIFCRMHSSLRKTVEELHWQFHKPFGMQVSRYQILLMRSTFQSPIRASVFQKKNAISFSKPFSKLMAPPNESTEEPGLVSPSAASLLKFWAVKFRWKAKKAQEVRLRCNFPSTLMLDLLFIQTKKLKLKRRKLLSKLKLFQFLSNLSLRVPWQTIEIIFTKVTASS